MRIKSPSVYDTVISPFERLFIRRWRKLLWSEVSGNSVLEAGGGTGLNMDFYGKKHSVTFLDKEVEPLLKARRRSMKKQVQANFIRGDVENLPFPENCFDAAVATFLFCSTPTPDRGLTELRRVIKTGGTLYLLEHVRSAGKLGRILDSLSWPLYRLFDEHIARGTDEEVRRQGFDKVTVQPLMLDVVKLIIGTKGERSFYR